MGEKLPSQELSKEYSEYNNKMIEVAKHMSNYLEKINKLYLENKKAKKAAYMQLASIVENNVVKKTRKKLEKNNWEKAFPKDPFKSSNAYKQVQTFLYTAQNFANKLKEAAQRKKAIYKIPLDKLPRNQAMNDPEKGYKAYLRQQRNFFIRRFNQAVKEKAAQGIDHKEQAKKAIEIMTSKDWTGKKAEENRKFLENFWSLNNMSYFGEEKQAMFDQANCAGYLNIKDHITGTRALEEAFQDPLLYQLFYSLEGRDDIEGSFTEKNIRPRQYKEFQHAWMIANGPGFKSTLEGEKLVSFKRTSKKNETSGKVERTWKVEYSTTQMKIEFSKGGV